MTTLRSCATVGVFDGVHRGHQYLIERLVAAAEKMASPAVVLTFDPHPEALLTGSAPPALTTTAEKAILLRELGVDRLVVAKFDRRLAEMTPEEFVREVLVGQLNAGRLVVSPMWRFGRGGGGDVNLLAVEGERHGFEVEVVEPLVSDGRLISSTAIRGLLLKGQVESAAEMLGRWYPVEGPVVSGDGRGRELGYPTLNVEPPRDKLVPADGIYAVLAGPTGGPVDRFAVAHLGPRPTFDDPQRVMEVHLLDAGPETAWQRVTAAFVRRLRGVQRFDRVADLREQMARDVETARQELSRALHDSADMID
jgi:riboflavin kinase/FMN adenylyltransferase